MLALSVAVCISSAGVAGASPMLAHRSAQIEQRDTLEHLLDAIQQATKKLTDRLVGQSALADREAMRPVRALGLHLVSLADVDAEAVSCLREELLNLPPPVC